jgi:hypothetical protein
MRADFKGGIQISMMLHQVLRGAVNSEVRQQLSNKKQRSQAAIRKTFRQL